MTRIAVPPDAVRTPEAILEGQVIREMLDGRRFVYVPCHNCGGRGTYPSAMTPAGMCRFYCWQDRTPETYGKLPVELEKYVRVEQATDRRAYRAKVRWELDAPKRAQAAQEAAQREEAARLERERIDADIAARKAVSQHQGTIGERLSLELTVTRVASFRRPVFGASWKNETGYVIGMRDQAGNLFIWFGSREYAQGEQLTLKGTVKQHSEYEGEKQTVLQRVKVNNQEVVK